MWTSEYTGSPKDFHQYMIISHPTFLQFRKKKKNKENQLTTRKSLIPKCCDSKMGLIGQFMPHTAAITPSRSEKYNPPPLCDSTIHQIICFTHLLCQNWKFPHASPKFTIYSCLERGSIDPVAVAGYPFWYLSSRNHQNNQLHINWSNPEWIEQRNFFIKWDT